MVKSVEEVIEQWGIILADCENCGENKQQSSGVPFEDIEIVVNYFKDINSFANSIRH